MKKYLFAGCFFLLLLSFRNMGEDKSRPVKVKKAIDKSLALLQHSSRTFLTNAPLVVSCHSCHNQGLGVVTFALAKANGYGLNDTIIKEAIDSTCMHWNTTASRQTLAENDDPVAIVMTGNYDLWGLSAIQYKKEKTLELLAMNIMRKQQYAGNWVSVGQRPPMEYYSFSATALSVKNIQVFVPEILKTEIAHRVERARSWLTNNIPVANEERAFQLLGLTWSGGDKNVIARQAKKLLETQHADGGWSQLDSLNTDAYATGQSLYALNQSGQLPVTAPAYQKGVDFLLNTQVEDGSWHVKTRSFPFVPFVDSGFPHEKDQFISAAGSNWATLALLLTSKTN